MKKNLLFLTVLSLIALMASSCGRTIYRYHSTSARTIEPKHLMVTAPLIADIKVIGERISHTEVFQNVASFNERYLEEYRTLALAAASKSANADIIVGALFDVNFNSDVTRRNELRVTVIGYPAVYANFRNLEGEKDEWILDFYYPGWRPVIVPGKKMPMRQTPSSNETNQKRRRR